MFRRLIVLFLCFAACGGVVARTERREPAPVRTPFSQFPLQVGEWHGVPQPPFDPKILAVLGVDDYLTRGYYLADRSAVDLYVGYYSSQRQGDTMHSPLNCLPGAGWEAVSKSTIAVSVPGRLEPGNAPLVVNRSVVQKGLERQLVVYWYQSHGRVVASEYWGKFYLIRDAVRLNRTDGALVRIIAPVLGDPADHADVRAERLVVQFMTRVFPILTNYLPE